MDTVIDRNQLDGLNILVAEDEYMLADDLARALADAGARVLGPTGHMGSATIMAANEPKIDLAVLDINLRGDMVFPLADRLRERGVPLLFATGYDAAIIPERFRSVPRFEKPVPPEAVCAAAWRMREGGAE